MGKISRRKRKIGFTHFFGIKVMAVPPGAGRRKREAMEGKSILRKVSIYQS